MGFLDNLPFFRRSAAEAEVVAELPPAAAPAEAPAPEAPIEAAPVAAPPAAAPAVVAEPAAPADKAPAAPPAASEPAAPEPQAPTAAERAEAEALVRAVVRELPDFVTVAVLEQTAGRILAGQWAGHSGGAVEAAAANAELVRQTHLALGAMQLTADEQLQDIVITLRQQLHLLQLLPQRSWLLYLAVRSQDTNLALARTVLRSFAA